MFVFGCLLFQIYKHFRYFPNTQLVIFHRTHVKYEHCYVLEIEYDDLKSIPMILFKWFACGNEDTWGFFHRIDLTYRVRIELDEKQGELLVIQDAELNEPLITPPEALTFEMLDAYNRLYLQERSWANSMGE